MAKKNRAKELVGRVKGFAEALRRDGTLSSRFTCRTVKLDLKPRDFTPQGVRKTRDLLGASQAIFAMVLGVSPKTVQDWEQGNKEPQPIARRFMEEIQSDPDYWRKRIESRIVPSA